MNAKNGEMTPLGTYTWVIYYKDLENIDKRLVIHVNVIR
jgi:hypothetical protein